MFAVLILILAPYVNSVSYGWPEALNCERLVFGSSCSAAHVPSSVTGANCTGLTPLKYFQESEQALSKLVALGLSVLVASQDEVSSLQSLGISPHDSSRVLPLRRTRAANWTALIARC